MPLPRDGSDICSPDNVAPTIRLFISQSVTNSVISKSVLKQKEEKREVPFHNVPVALWCVYEHGSLQPTWLYFSSVVISRMQRPWKLQRENLAIRIACCGFH